jgi:hypothetical protein
MWAPEGKTVKCDSLGPLAPVEVLFEFEEPLTFVCKDLDAQLLIAHNLWTDGSISRYLVSVTDDRIIQELKAGRLDVLGSLRQPRCWVADIAAGWKVVHLWLTPFDRIPRDYLPSPGAMISPELDPVFRIRLVGPGVGPGRTSAADIRMAAQAAESGLRGLARIALDVRKQAGPAPRTVRDFSDLPYQFTLAASFEIAFGRPAGRLARVDDEVFGEMGRILDDGLLNLRENGDGASPIKGLDAEQTLQLYEAIKAFTPSTRGGVDRVEVGGVLVESIGGPKVLTRDDRVRTVRRIKAARTAPRFDEPFRVAGVVEEADQGEYSFILRHLGHQAIPAVDQLSEIRFRFDDHLFDAVMEAFNSSDRMLVVGERIGAIYKALDVQLDADTQDFSAG